MESGGNVFSDYFGVDGSCGRSSPGRNHDYVDDAYYTYSDGDIKDDGIVGISFGALPSSYGIAFYTKKFLTFALRTSASAAAVSTAFIRMVMSTVGMSRIPTGGALRARNSIHHVL